MRACSQQAYIVNEIPRVRNEVDSASYACFDVALPIAPTSFNDMRL